MSDRLFKLMEVPRRAAACAPDAALPAGAGKTAASDQDRVDLVRERGGAAGVDSDGRMPQAGDSGSNVVSAPTMLQEAIQAFHEVVPH
jgi:hypothetical protein